MKEHLHRFSRSLVHAGFLAALMVIGVAVTPREAKAYSKVCAPDNRGCYYTRLPCSQLDSPKNWTCTKVGRLARPQRLDAIVRESDGRAVASVGGQKVFILSDNLETLLSGKDKKATDFAQLLRADRGAVSDEALKQASAELGVPVGKPSPR